MIVLSFNYYITVVYLSYLLSQMGRLSIVTLSQMGQHQLFINSFISYAQLHMFIFACLCFILCITTSCSYSSKGTRH